MPKYYRVGYKRDNGFQYPFFDIEFLGIPTGTPSNVCITFTGETSCSCNETTCLFYPYGEGTITSSGSQFNIVCGSGGYMLFTGNTGGDVVVLAGYDAGGVDGYAVFTITGGTFGCGNSVSYSNACYWDTYTSTYNGLKWPGDTPYFVSYNCDPYYNYVIDTRLTGSSTTNEFQYEIPDFTSTDGEINVDWGDGNISNGLTGDTTHTYSTSGIYTIKLYPNTGQFINSIEHYNPPSPYDNNKIIEFISWGSDVSDWTTMKDHFAFAVNLSGFTTDIPELSGATNMEYMFYDTLFNEDISSWDISSITSLRDTFGRTDLFNQPLNSWDTSNVVNMRATFFDTSSFNQPLNSWDTSNVTSMYLMFTNATSFNQDLGSWNISSLTDASNMFDGSGLSTTNYDNLLIGWAAQAPNIQSGVILGASGINRTSASASAYNLLTTTYSWTINDAGQI